MATKSTTAKQFKKAIKSRILPPTVEMAVIHGVKEAFNMIAAGKNTAKVQLEVPSPTGEDGVVLQISVKRKG